MCKMFFLLSGWIFFVACQQKTRVNTIDNSDSSSAFFPVTDYLLAQVSDLNNTPVTPLKIITYNGKTDSAWMKPEDTKAFVQNFLTPVIDSALLVSLFEERSFLDQTINTFTFTYDPIKPLHDTSVLRRWDVYIDADMNTVKRIYIEKKLHAKNSSQLQKLTWRTGMYCKIITLNESDTSLQHVKEEQLIWNFNE